MILYDGGTVHRRFSRAAGQYTGRSALQHDIARELSLLLKPKAGQAVLDVGCGTGALLCESVRSLVPVTAVGLDAAEGMLEGARRAYPSLCWARGDAAALPFKAWSFDLVFSSSTYQWVPDLAGAFGEVRRVLKTDGRFYAALFGRATLCEFFESLEAAALIHGRHEPFSLRRLPSEEDVRLALKAAGFRHRGVVREVRSVVFQNALDLLRWLKGIGANALSPRFFLGKDLLGDLETHYGARYPLEGGIKASFEIIWLDAVK